MSSTQDKATLTLYLFVWESYGLFLLMDRHHFFAGLKVR